LRVSIQEIRNYVNRVHRSADLTVCGDSSHARLKNSRWRSEDQSPWRIPSPFPISDLNFAVPRRCMTVIPVGRSQRYVAERYRARSLATATNLPCTRGPKGPAFIKASISSTRLLMQVRYARGATNLGASDWCAPADPEKSRYVRARSMIYDAVAAPVPDTRSPNVAVYSHARANFINTIARDSRMPLCRRLMRGNAAAQSEIASWNSWRRKRVCSGQGCGGRIFNYGGRFTSPLYPNIYRNNTVCTWDLSVPQGFKVIMQFLVFDIGTRKNCENNHLKVYDVINSEQLLRSTYCGGVSVAVVFAKRCVFEGC